jgi:hypothetical protein
MAAAGGRILFVDAALMARARATTPNCVSYRGGLDKDPLP